MDDFDDRIVAVIVAVVVVADERSRALLLLLWQLAVVDSNRESLGTSRHL